MRVDVRLLLVTAGGYNIYIYIVYIGGYICLCRGMQASVDGYVCRGRQRETERAVEVSGCSEVCGGLGGEGLDAAGVTVFAEDVSVQRVAALVIPL